MFPSIFFYAYVNQQEADSCPRYDFKNKRVGVIGGGSSSIQIVPSLQKVEGVKMSCFVRSRTWISNPFGDRMYLILQTSCLSLI